MKIIYSLLFIVGFNGAAYASEVLDIPATSSLSETISSCTPSVKGGLTSTGSDQCILKFPIPLSSGHTIKQVSVYYGVASATSVELTAHIRYKDLRVSSNVNGVDHGTGLAWSFNGSGSTSTVYSGNLMAQSGIYPLVAYPDAFAVGGDKAYYVNVVLGLLDSPEFFGVRVVYD